MRMVSDVSGIEQALARIRRAQSELPRLTKEAAQKAGNTIKEKLADAAPRGRAGGTSPPGDASGTLASSFEAHAEQRGIGAHLEVKTHQSLKLRYVTKGTGVYIGKGRIKPLTKQALYWPGAAHPVRSVRGIRGRDFVTPVLSRADGAVQVEMDAMQQALAAIVEGA